MCAADDFALAAINLCAVNRWQWTTALLHWEGWQGDMAATQSHVLQPPRPASVPQLWTAQWEINICHRRNRRLWTRI